MIDDDGNNPPADVAVLPAWTVSWLARSQPPAVVMSRLTLWLDERSQIWKTEERDVHEALAGFLQPRAAIARRWKDAWRTLAISPAVLNTSLPVAAQLARRYWDEYAWLRARLIPQPRADGLRTMTPVQRALFYGLFVQFLSVTAIWHRLDMAQQGVQALDEVVVADLDHVQHMSTLTGELLVVRLLVPLKHYTLAHLDTTLNLLVRSLNRHGLAGIPLANVMEMWMALWVCKRPSLFSFTLHMDLGRV